MSVTLVDMVKVIAASGGTGALTLGAPVVGYFGTERLVDGLEYSYTIQQGAQLECGHCIYNASTNQITRSPSSSSSSGAPIAVAVNTPIAFTALAVDLNFEPYVAAAQSAQAAAVTSAASAAASAAEAETILGNVVTATELAAPSGAGSVGYAPETVYGDGTVGARLARAPLPTDAPWSCDPTGNTECSAGATAYIAWCAANGFTPNFRDGTWLWSSTVTSAAANLDFTGSSIKWQPASGYGDLYPALQITGGMNGTGHEILGLNIVGPQSYTMGQATTWCPNPGTLPGYGAFASGPAAIQVLSANQCIFRNCKTSGVKIGLLLDAVDGHIQTYECGWYGWLAGVYPRINSEDFAFTGGTINGVFASILIGTVPFANHFGGALVNMQRVAPGFSAYGVYQVTETITVNLTTTTGSSTAAYTVASGQAPAVLAAPMAIAATSLTSGTTIIGANSAAVNLSAPAISTGTTTATVTIASNTPTLGLYGTIDAACNWEQIGEALVQTLTQSAQQNLQWSGWGFSWSQIFTGWGTSNPSGWASNLHPSILAYASQQQYALRLGTMTGYNAFSAGFGFGFPPRSQYATSPQGIALVNLWQGLKISPLSDFTALNDGLPNPIVVTSYDTGSRRTYARGGDIVRRNDLSLPGDWLSGNLMQNPEVTGNWAVSGTTISTTTLSALGATVPQGLYDLLGQNPTITAFTAAANGTATLAAMGGAVAAQANRKICLSFWLYSVSARTRLVTGSGGYVYDYDTTTPGGVQWQKLHFDWALLSSQLDSFQISCGATTTGTTATLTGGSTSATLSGGSPAVGQSITASGIPANTTITAYNSSTGVATLSAAATTTGSVSAVLYTWQPAYIAGLMVSFDDEKPYNPFPAPAIANASTGTTAPAAGGAGALPATPTGYLTVVINGTSRQVAYY